MPEFKDESFKAYLTLFMWSDPGFKKALKAAVKKAGADLSDLAMSEGVAQFLVEYPLEEEWLASIRSLDWPDTRAITAAVPGWTGEEAPYCVRDFSDLCLLENLEEFQWPDTGEVPADAIPDHPKLKKVKLPTDFFGKAGMQTNQPAFDALIARGFSIEDQEEFGTTRLVRK